MLLSKLLDSGLRRNDDKAIDADRQSVQPESSPLRLLWTRLHGCGAFGELSRAVLERRQEQAAEEPRSRPAKAEIYTPVIPAKAGIQWLI